MPGISLYCRKTGHGVMFYTNGSATPTSGARKKIHGGSGISGHGDSYGPGCTLYGMFVLWLWVNFVMSSCGVFRIP